MHTFERRGFLKLAGFAGLSWLAPVGELLAQQAKEKPRPANSADAVIVLWMGGGPSQLETFDPPTRHPRDISGETKAISTAVGGIQIAEGLPRVAEQMEHLSIIRSMVSKEGDHERGTYTLKTGYRPDPTVGTMGHPSLGSIIWDRMPSSRTDIPQHISIFPGAWPARGGFLGDKYDAFKVYDPAQKVPDVELRVPDVRDQVRMKDLDVVESAFARGRVRQVQATGHRETIDRARTMMSSAQLKAFDISQEPAKVREAYGDTPFGRGCLAARRLVEVGVRCVEVTLDGWDTHVNNYTLTRNLVGILDPAFAALLKDLRERDLLRKTIVLCLGEFGRTPRINPAGGRDHWPDGFSVALAGGPIRPGKVIGATDPQGSKKVERPVAVGDLHATVLAALGLNPKEPNPSPLGRSVRLAEGDPVKELL
jgi:hypothetical protein